MRHWGPPPLKRALEHCAALSANPSHACWTQKSWRPADWVKREDDSQLRSSDSSGGKATLFSDDWTQENKQRFPGRRAALSLPSREELKVRGTTDEWRGHYEAK